MIESNPRQRVTNVTAWNSPAGGAFAGGDWCEAVAVSLGDVLECDLCHWLLLIP